ncbi:uncharacterized protein C10orf67 homolog, mitochondrial [Hypomesus transpacificus]|uniref:uncharacterized protein C10orf67 homolog, mitochondrial n=1 Tax=Hypomesus transpacificus TaxID=137520 RepID=UPI001F07BF4D|nr:uncharacterized protein C10orf67 homolog, mitochondrial [Hypomesus transpacificus]
MDVVKKQQTYFMHEEEEEEEEKQFSKEVDEIQRSSIGNQLRVGFFGRDACAQTDVSELPTINLLSSNTTALIKEIEKLRKEVEMKVKFMKAQYKSRLQEEAECLYARINDKVKSLENHHKEKVRIIRKSYQQQFADAIPVINASLKRYYMKRGDRVETLVDDTDQMKALVAELQKKTLQMDCMGEQLRDYEQRTLAQINSDQGLEDAEKDWLRSENERLKDDLDSVHMHMEEILASVGTKEQQLEDQAYTIRKLKADAAEDKLNMQKMSNDCEQLKAQINLEKENSKRKIKAVKQDLEKELKGVEESHKNEKLAMEMKLEDKQQAEKERHKAEIQAREGLMKAQAAEKHPVVQKEEGDLIQQLESLKKTETALRSQTAKLQKELFRSNELWEVKFEVLNRSFHAVKDEMFLRQTLQRQAAQLQHASVTYTMETPVYHQSAGGYSNGFKIPGYTKGTPLPNIGTGGHHERNCTHQRRDIVVPDGRRGTNALSCSAESQLESGDDDDDDDGEEELVGILPHPSSPARQTSSLTSAVNAPFK